MDRAAEVAAAALLSDRGCTLLSGGSAGQVVRLVRTSLGWTQRDLGARSGWSQSTISRIEEGKTRAAHDMQVLGDLALALRIPPTLLGVAAEVDQPPILDDMRRREVLGGTVALAVTLLLPQGVAAAGRIGSEDVAQCWTALRRLHELDAQQGGASVYQVAEGMARRMQDALRRGSYAPGVGRELRQVTAETMEQAGWLAHDAGWGQQAHQWWLETRHLADLSDIPDAHVRALASMSLQAGERPDGGAESAQLAQAATTAASQGASTPSLLSLLSAREAIGHARAGDRAAATTAIARARHHLDHTSVSDEPFWLGFYGPADLAWHEARVGVLTRRPREAETAARAAVGAVDATAYPRNHVLYTTRLGSLLTQFGQLDEAISVTRDAVRRVDAVRGSGRILGELRATVSQLGRRDYAPARSFATAAARLLPTAG